MGKFAHSKSLNARIIDTALLMYILATGVQIKETVMSSKKVVFILVSLPYQWNGNLEYFSRKFLKDGGMLP